MSAEREVARESRDDGLILAPSFANHNYAPVSLQWLWVRLTSFANTYVVHVVTLLLSSGKMSHKWFNFSQGICIVCLFWYSTSRSSELRILERGCSFGNRKLEKRRKHWRRSFWCCQSRDWLWLRLRSDRSERAGWGWAACSPSVASRRSAPGEARICFWYVWTPQALTSRMKGLGLSTWNGGWGLRNKVGQEHWY